MSASDDTVTMALMLSAQYDSGHYQFIRFNDANGQLITEHSRASPYNTVPQWLIALFPIKPTQGVAHVSNGWQQLGTLTLQSDTLFAYEALWQSTQRLLSYFLIAALFSGVCGSLLLHGITRPLTHVVEQARAMEQRRFITLPTPNTLEFKTLTEAMNSLSIRIKQMLAKESQQLAALHKSLKRDKLTGLLNRAPFMEQLHAHLQREEGSSAGTVVIVRIISLTELNNLNSRNTMDKLLKKFGQQFIALQGLHKGYVHGRLNGSDFAILAPQEFNPEALARQIRELLLNCAHELMLHQPPEVAAAASQYQTEDTSSSLLSRIDAALCSAANDGLGNIGLATFSSATVPSSNQQRDDWQEIINDALQNNRIQLASYPVYDRQMQLLHWEAPSRLITNDNNTITAAQFMPWVNRLGLSSEFDCQIVELALQRIQYDQRPLGINILARTLSDETALTRIIASVNAQPQSAKQLWIEIPEVGAYQYLDSFRVLCAALKPLGCKLGIEHVGPDIAHIGQLHDLGLDYLKLDASLCATAHKNLGNQAFIRGLCTIAHTIGLLAIAEGVSEKAAWDCLLELGIDGGTGRLFSEE